MRKMSNKALVIFESYGIIRTYRFVHGEQGVQRRFQKDQSKFFGNHGVVYCNTVVDTLIRRVSYGTNIANRLF